MAAKNRADLSTQQDTLFTGGVADITNVKLKQHLADNEASAYNKVNEPIASGAEVDTGTATDKIVAPLSIENSSLVKKTGTPADNQVAVFTDDRTIEGTSLLAIDSGSGAITLGESIITHLTDVSSVGKEGSTFILLYDLNSNGGIDFRNYSQTTNEFAPEIAGRIKAAGESFRIKGSADANSDIADNPVFLFHATGVGASGTVGSADYLAIEDLVDGTIFQVKNDGSLVVTGDISMSGSITSGTWGGIAIEGTTIASTGEAGGTKFLREDGDGTCSWQTIAGGGDALTANPLSQFAATTSLQLKDTISDETGSGALVFATSPTLVTPVLGAATATTINGATITSGTLNGTVTGSNTGDQTSIVGISGTKAEFNTGVSDGTILFVGDAPTAHTHIASEVTDFATAVGADAAVAANTAKLTANTANVDAAGATMNADTTTAAMSFVIDEDTMVSDSATKIPTQQSVKAYVDTQITTEKSYQGGYNASTNTPDLDTSPIAGILKGDVYDVTAAGTFFTIAVEIGDSIRATQDTPTLESHWTIVQGNLSAASIKTQYESNADTNAYTDAEKTVVGNTTGTNSGDQTSIVGITGTTAQFNTALTDGSFATGGGTATGANTGDQTSIVGITGTVAQFNTAITDATISGNNTGDQTSIVGISGTTAEFNTALTDGSFATGGGTATGSNTGDQTITLTGDVTGTGTGSFATTIAVDAVDIAMLSATGTPDATTFLRGDNTWAAPAGGGDALVANPLSQFAATTSLELKNTISDETGSGALVFATSPTLVTPALGTPASGVATNLTGTAAGLTAGAVSTITGLAPDTATTAAAQPNITSVGTLTALDVDNININGNTISSTAGVDLNITPLAGQQIVLDGTVVIDAGVITGVSTLNGATITSGTLNGSVTGTNTGDEVPATSGEINTGTDATKYISPDALAGSNLGIRYMMFTVTDYTTDVATGDGKGYAHVPPGLDGMNLVYAHAEVITAGTTGTTDIQIHNVDNALDMLSTKLTVDSAETGSDTATAYVINASNDHVNTNDVIRVDVDAISTTAPKGLIVTLGFQLP